VAEGFGSRAATSSWERDSRSMPMPSTWRGVSASASAATLSSIASSSVALTPRDAALRLGHAFAQLGKLRLAPEIDCSSRVGKHQSSSKVAALALPPYVSSSTAATECAIQREYG
jgi:hypothetical protein